MRALFSVEWHEGLDKLAARLVRRGWKLVVTPNLAEPFERAGISFESVADFVGFRGTVPFPPTMHPHMELALAGDVENRIDLLYEMPYSLDKGFDAGGLALISLALKGGRLIAASREDMELLVNVLEESGGPAMGAGGDVSGSAGGDSSGGAGSPAGESVGSVAERLRQNALLMALGRHLEFASARHGIEGIAGRLAYELLNGENPYQKPAYLVASDSGDPLSLSMFTKVSGESPCFTNMADFDFLLQCLCRTVEAFRKNLGSAPYIAALAKHGNPCGMAYDWDHPHIALEKALFGNARAIWGGECVVNFPIDDRLAKMLRSSSRREEMLGNPNWMLHLIAAPQFQEDSVEILGKQPVRKLFVNPALSLATIWRKGWSFREVRGGFLKQPHGDYIPELPPLEKHVAELLILAWSVAFGSFHGGNEIALVKDSALIGAGGGPSTVDAAASAVERAARNGHDASGSVFGADAFFPFTDAPEILARAGCEAGIVPGGGKQEGAVHEFFKSRNMKVIYLPEDARGFCRH